jgi:hypothetical protein
MHYSTSVMRDLYERHPTVQYKFRTGMSEVAKLYIVLCGFKLCFQSELCNIIAFFTYVVRVIKSRRIIRTCSIHGRNEKSIQKFVQNTSSWEN